MNIESAVAESFDDLGFAVTRTGTDLQQRIGERGTVIRVSQVGGPVDFLEGRYRLVVEVYAARYTTMWTVAEQVTTRLANPPLWAAGVLLDNTVCEGSFAERPYTEGTRVVVSTWVLTARHYTRRTA